MHEKPAVCLGFMPRLRHHPVYSVSGAFQATQVSAKITVKDHRKWSLHHSRAGLHLIFCPCCFVHGALASGIFFKPPLSTRQNLHFLGLLSFYFAFTSCWVTQQGTQALLVILPRLWVHFFFQAFVAVLPANANLMLLYVMLIRAHGVDLFNSSEAVIKMRRFPYI